MTGWRDRPEWMEKLGGSMQKALTVYKAYIKKKKIKTKINLFDPMYKALNKRYESTEHIIIALKTGLKKKKREILVLFYHPIWV